LPGERIVAQPLLQEVRGGGGGFASAIGHGTIRLHDSLTYASVPSPITIDPGQALVVAADNRQRPVLRVAPGTKWTFVGQTDADGNGSTLVLDGLWLCGCDVVLQGTFARVTLKTCTVDPGDSRDGSTPDKAADGAALAPGHLTIAGQVRSLELDRCLLGPIGMDPDPKKAEVEAVDVRDCVVQAVIHAEAAIDLRSGACHVARTTILGKSQFHRIEASDVIFDDVATVLDAQEGCTRFCAYATGSRLPRLYECVEILAGRELFVSRAFGRPAYAQLLESTDDSISTGAEDGSEMGAYCRDKASIRERSLLVKLQEYMPVGVTPVLIYAT
jgi:hypothetical protein